MDTYYYWDSQNRMTKIDMPNFSKTVEYKYDAFGRRVARRLNAGAWNWCFYNGLNVQAEGTGTADRTFNTTTGGPGGLIAREKNGTKYFYHYDRLGNVVAITDGSGNLAGGYTMDAFGNVVERGDSTGYSGSAGEFQPYHQTTKELDADTGLYCFNARWYDPALGRFVSEEPTRRDGPNLYAFCLNNPCSFYDPNGREVVRAEQTRCEDTATDGNGPLQLGEVRSSQPCNEPGLGLAILGGIGVGVVVGGGVFVLLPMVVPAIGFGVVTTGGGTACGGLVIGTISTGTAATAGVVTGAGAGIGWGAGQIMNMQENNSPNTKVKPGEKHTKPEEAEEALKSLEEYIKRHPGVRKNRHEQALKELLKKGCFDE